MTDGQILYEHYRSQLGTEKHLWGGNILSVTTSHGVPMPNTIQFGVPWADLSANAKQFWNNLAGRFQDALFQ